MKEQKIKITNNKARYKQYVILAAIFTGAFALRIFIAGSVLGHTTDMGCFSYWSEQAFTDGLLNFYNGTFVCDYPPLYIYFLWFAEFLRSSFNLMFATAEHIIILKLPSIIFDMLTAYFVYKIVKPRFSENTALLLSVFTVLNPAFIFNSSAWGQIDSILTLLLAVSVYYVTLNKIEAATIFYVLAVLLKPQAFIFAPVLIFAYIKNADIKRVLKSLGCGLALFIVTILPFAIGQHPLWIFDLYFGTMAQYAYSTVNAYNIYALLGQNWSSDSQVLFLLPYYIYGYIAIISSCAIVTWGFIKNPDKPGFSYATAGFLMTMVFTFVTKMHERYIFPSLLFTLMAFIYAKEKRFLYIHIMQTITFLANCVYVLKLDVTGGADFFSPYVAIVSAFNVFIAVWYIKVYVELYILNKDNLPLKYLT